MNLERLLTKARADIQQDRGLLTIMRAVDTLEAAESEAPSNVELQFLLTRGNFLLGSFDKAVEHGFLGRSLSNTSLENYLLIGNSLEQLGDFSAAKDIWQEATHRYHLNQYLHTDLGHAHLMLGEYGQAKMHLNIARGLDPSNLRPYLLLNTIYMQTGELTKVKEISESAIDNGLESPFIYRQKAFAHLINKEYVEAENASIRSMELEEPDTIICAIRADALRGQNKLSEAKVLYNIILDTISVIPRGRRDRDFYYNALLADEGFAELGMLEPKHFEKEGILNGVISAEEARHIHERKILPLQANMPMRNPFYGSPNPSERLNT